MTNLEYQNYLQLMESGYIKLSPRDATVISSSCAKTQLSLPSNRTKSAGKSFIYLIFEF